MLRSTVRLSFSSSCDSKLKNTAIFLQSAFCASFPPASVSSPITFPPFLLATSEHALPFPTTTRSQDRKPTKAKRRQIRKREEEIRVAGQEKLGVTLRHVKFAEDPTVSICTIEVQRVARSGDCRGRGQRVLFVPGTDGGNFPSPVNKFQIKAPQHCVSRLRGVFLFPVDAERRYTPVPSPSGKNRNYRFSFFTFSVLSSRQPLQVAEVKKHIFHLLKRYYIYLKTTWHVSCLIPGRRDLPGVTR